MVKIKVKNIYYMLSYAFRTLQEQAYQDVAAEEFEYAADMLAAILAKGISSQIKRGLCKNYIPRSETLSSPRGRIDLSTSIREQTMLSRKLACVYDSYEENTYFNQILKSAMLWLMKSDEVKAERKKSLRRLMLYFDNVDIIAPKSIRWKGLSYSKHNAAYKMLLNICYLAIQGLIQTDEKGSLKMAKYLDDRQMYALYEKFLLEYYRKHYPKLEPMPSGIDWNEDNGYLELLPKMKTDITLNYQGKTMIIDAKLYSEMLQYNQAYHSATLRSSHMYQIFAYVKNKDINNDGSVSGVLLYAKTADEEDLNQTYLMGGNQIKVKSLDLNQEFDLIRKELDELVEKGGL